MPRCVTCRAVITTLIAAFAGTAAHPEAHCIAESPGIAGDGPGFEFIDIGRLQVWASRDWTVESFEAFEMPVTEPFWFKNSPRLLEPDRAVFRRSPGCAAEGHFTYRDVDGRQHLHVVSLIKVARAVDPDGLIKQTDLIKHHVLEYDGGRTIALLIAPDGRRFIRVSRGLESEGAVPHLPEGWRIEEAPLGQNIIVDLDGAVSVLRLDNGDSYQGPLPERL
ncbi:MAG: hypothetical protein AAGI50_19995 [Pseudomonadota bacterium]